MCSRPFRPLGLPIYVARGPAAPFTRRYPSRLCLLCRFAQKLHSLDRDVFCVANPISSIETQSLPSLLRCYPCSFTFYVADPISSIETQSLPSLLRCYPCSFTFYVADP